MVIKSLGHKWAQFWVLFGPFTPWNWSHNILTGKRQLYSPLTRPWKKKFFKYIKSSMRYAVRKILDTKKKITSQRNGETFSTSRAIKAAYETPPTRNSLASLARSSSVPLKTDNSSELSIPNNLGWPLARKMAAFRRRAQAVTKYRRDAELTISHFHWTKDPK